MEGWTKITSVKDAENFGFEAEDFAEAFKLLKSEYDLMAKGLRIGGPKLELEMVADNEFEEDGFAANVSFGLRKDFGFRSHFDKQEDFFRNIKPYLFDFLGQEAVRSNKEKMVDYPATAEETKQEFLNDLRAYESSKPIDAQTAHRTELVWYDAAGEEPKDLYDEYERRIKNGASKEEADEWKRKRIIEKISKLKSINNPAFWDNWTIWAMIING